MDSYKDTKRTKKPAQIKSTNGLYRDWIQFQEYRHYDRNLEASILGICTISPGSFAMIRRFLSPEMFYVDLHKSIFKAMVELFDNSFPIDIHSLVNYIYKNPDETTSIYITNNQLASAIASLSLYVVRDTHLEYWAMMVREQFIERKLLELTTSGMTDAPAREEMLRIQKQIDDLLQYRVADDDWLHISDVVIQLYKHMEEVKDLEMVGETTGFHRIDKITGGFTPGLYYLGARPSVGKTALALKMIASQAAAQIPIGIISLETKGVKLAARVLSMFADVEYWRIYRNRMTPELAKMVFEQYASLLATFPIYISDTPAVTIVDIRAKAFKLVAKGARVLYIDYLQLVNPTGNAGTREQEVAMISRGLKLLSMQLNIPIIALAQLSRESEKRTEKRPRLIDLRESGSIEQDADGVMLLHRPWMSGEKEDEHGHSTEKKAELIFAKWRDGETFTHDLLFEGSRMEFKEDEIAFQERKGWTEDAEFENVPTVAIPNLPANTNTNTRPNTSIPDEEDPF